jgi:crossover junction endodeoxyribonuclease RuvC
VDTALRVTGFGLVDVNGKAFSAVDCGVIKTTRQQPLSECLRRLSGGIRELVEAYAPDVAAVEGAFYCKNVRTAMVLGSARGAVIATLAELELPIYEYAPRKVKQSVCGYGNASKQQVALLVGTLLGIETGHLASDATDALALAVCHAHARGNLQGLTLPDPI